MAEWRLSGGVGSRDERTRWREASRNRTHRMNGNASCPSGGGFGAGGGRGPSPSRASRSRADSAVAAASTQRIGPEQRGQVSRSAWNTCLSSQRPVGTVRNGELPRDSEQRSKRAGICSKQVAEGPGRSHGSGIRVTCPAPSGATRTWLPRSGFRPESRLGEQPSGGISAARTIRSPGAPSVFRAPPRL